MIGMANNLEKMILSSGMSKREVAQIKGVTPETLSRHMHGKVQMSLLDAEQYAKIIGCSTYDVIFATDPVDILGYTHITQDGSFRRELAAGKKLGKLYLHSYIEKDTAAIIWSSDKKYSGAHKCWSDSIELVKKSPMLENKVDGDAIMNEAYCYLSEPLTAPDKFEGQQLITGVLYPEPGGTYTVHNTYRNAIRKGLHIEWATPVLTFVLRPELRGLKIVLDK